MRLHHRGLAIELPDDDPRIPVFEALLFGRALPPPLPAPPEPVPVAPPGPRTPVPPRWLAFWRALPELLRRELAVLAEGPALAEALERAMGLGKGDLNATNALLTRMAGDHGLGEILTRRGRGRAQRRFHVTPAFVPILRQLAADDAEDRADAARRERARYGPPPVP